ncbi:hypothetical protein BDY19DRAFT_601218 [Irpex rosettiformis]|uniref:Uncharacterized protein n=1 Tax=Irpex rosettiformis TaxID=378272 RepID=A0ACB8TPM4_9APHY|nr:hypothetical protein BDY19DRAFT_601218 [Irpex rosettiformis]
MADVLVEQFVGASFALFNVIFILYGLLCAQVYFYWTSYRDRMLVKGAVLSMITLETVHVALCIEVLYSYFVDNYGRSDYLLHMRWSIGTSISLEFIVKGIVQAYYINRIWRLRHNTVVCLLLVTLLLAHSGVAFRSAACLFQFPTWVIMQAESHFWLYSNVTFALNLVFDVAITSVLSFYLHQDRSSALKEHMRDMVGKIMRYAIGGSVLTLPVSIALFVTANTSRLSLTFGAIVEASALVYSNAMLAMLNARRRIAEGLTAIGNDALEERSQVRNQVAPRFNTTIQIYQGGPYDYSTVDERRVLGTSVPNTPHSGPSHVIEPTREIHSPQ